MSAKSALNSAAGQMVQERTLNTPPITPVLAALDMWENYKPTCCVMLFSFFLTPPQDLPQQNWSGTFHFLASALLPSMKRVIIRLASNWKR